MDDTKHKKVKRRKMWRLQNKQCWWCYDAMPYEEATLDRIIPGNDGGGYTWDNVVVACEPCNSVRGDLPVQEWVKVIALFHERRRQQFKCVA